MSDLRNYWKTLTETKMIALIFNDHFEERGFEKISTNKYDLKDNITVEFQPNSLEPSILITDHTTSIVTSFLFDNEIAYKSTLILKIQRHNENYYLEDFIEDQNIYDLLNLLEREKETYLIE